MRLHIKQILQKPYYLWEIFHTKTKRRYIPIPKPSKNWPEEWKIVYYKEYPRLDRIILPQSKVLKNNNFKKVILKRKSSREFNKIGLTLEQISSFLFYSVGLKKTKMGRMYPSAGERYPLEIYVLSLNSDLPIGIYHYNVKQHSLEILNFLELINIQDYFNHKWIKDSSLIILITAVFERNTIKYGDRGYRQILQEAGHIGQNFYLLSSALNTGICTLDGYIDDKINDLLDIDGVKEAVIYTMAIGNVE